MRRGLPSWSRRDCLAFFASAGVLAAAGMTVAAKATGQSDAPAGSGIGQSGTVADSCGLLNAPWLNRRIAEEFEQYRPGWAAIRATYLARCDTMQAALIERQQQGFTCPIADQIYAEARWLAGTTTDQPRILARFADFNEALSRQRDLYDLPPIGQAEDGSWAPYVTEPFHKLDISIDYINRIVGVRNPVLQRCDGGEATPVMRRPLTFLKRWADPDAMIQELLDCQYSSIHQTGHWNRQKYGSLLSSLCQIMLKTPIETWLREVAGDTTFTPRHKAKLLQFLDEKQDPCTGCWRDGYHFADGTSHEAYDLSNLYHIVQYRRDGIRHWDAIADGLLAVREFQYPQGPLNLTQEADDHNDYDVLRIALRCLDDARPAISDDRRAQLQSYIHNIALGAVRRVTQNFPAGEAGHYVSTVESACYRVQLLELIGFWGGSSRFLAAGEMQDRRRLAEAMLKRLAAYDDPSPMPVYAIALLRSRLLLC